MAVLTFMGGHSIGTSVAAKMAGAARAMGGVPKAAGAPRKPRKPPEPPLEAYTVEFAVRRMTNWQRNQWARSGYPREAAKLRHFCTLKKSAPRPAPKRKRAARKAKP